MDGLKAFKAIISILDLIIALGIGIYSIKDAPDKTFHLCTALFFWVIANAAGLWL